jgi:inorganic pyrophosphatase/exopolyphosphatase
VRGSSELLYRGLESVRRALPYRRDKDGVLLMPGVVSRKKQLLPEVLAALA